MKGARILSESRKNGEQFLYHGFLKNDEILSREKCITRQLNEGIK